MDIISLNQQELFTTIDKRIRFCGLVTLANKTKEQCYRALDVVMIYYKKSGFFVKLVEFDGEFKSTMDEVGDKMVIGINYENTYDHFPEAERNNGVIKQRFRVSYYRFPYKNIPRIMIRHFSINVMRDLNIFPAKGGVSDHYIPHIILSHRNQDYNKHFQFEFSAYVQASKANDPNNTNHPRTLDGIYL